MYICHIQNFKILASFCSCAGWFESYLVEKKPNELIHGLHFLNNIPNICCIYGPIPCWLYPSSASYLFWQRTLLLLPRSPASQQLFVLVSQLFYKIRDFTELSICFLINISPSLNGDSCKDKFFAKHYDKSIR